MFKKKKKTLGSSVASQKLNTNVTLLTNYIVLISGLVCD